MKINDVDRADAIEAMKSIYGEKSGYQVSDHDIEMMLEFEAIRKKSKDQNTFGESEDKFNEQFAKNGEMPYGTYGGYD
jgi:hypothetical protein